MEGEQVRERNGTSLVSFFNDAHRNLSANSLIHRMLYIFLLSAVLCLFSRENLAQLLIKREKEREREMLVYERKQTRGKRKRK